MQSDLHTHTLTHMHLRTEENACEKRKVYEEDLRELTEEARSWLQVA